MLDICIPCFNPADYLSRCLASIQEVFAEHYSEICVWIIDDCSNYESEYQSLITTFNFPIQYYRNYTNLGPGQSRNYVLEHGTNPWVTFMDDDDVFTDSPLNHLSEANDYDICAAPLYTSKGSLFAENFHVVRPLNGLIFSSSFLKSHNARFLPQLRWRHEDCAFIVSCMMQTNRIKYLSEGFSLRMIRSDTEPQTTFSGSRPDDDLILLNSLMLMTNESYEIVNPKAIHVIAKDRLVKCLSSSCCAPQYALIIYAWLYGLLQNKMLDDADKYSKFYQFYLTLMRQCISIKEGVLVYTPPQNTTILNSVYLNNFFKSPHTLNLVEYLNNYFTNKYGKKNEGKE